MYSGSNVKTNCVLNKLNVFPYRISFVEEFKSLAFVVVFETSLVALQRRHAESSTRGHGFTRLCPGDTKLVRTVHSRNTVLERCIHLSLNWESNSLLYYGNGSTYSL